MLCCPALSLVNASSRFPGGDSRSRRVVAASSISSFRVAILRIEPNFWDLSVSKSFCVSAHLNPWIATRRLYTVYRYTASTRSATGKPGLVRPLVDFLAPEPSGKYVRFGHRFGVPAGGEREDVAIQHDEVGRFADLD